MLQLIHIISIILFVILSTLLGMGIGRIFARLKGWSNNDVSGCTIVNTLISGMNSIMLWIPAFSFASAMSYTEKCIASISASVIMPISVSILVFTVPITYRFLIAFCTGIDRLFARKTS